MLGQFSGVSFSHQNNKKKTHDSVYPQTVSEVQPNNVWTSVLPEVYLWGQLETL